MEIRYYRGANTKAPTLTEEAEEREITEDKQEVVVFFIPNVSHLVPSDEEWEKTKQSYADALLKLLAPAPEKSDEAAPKEEAPAAAEQMETSQAAETTLNESQDTSHAEPVEGEPTHHSKLDVNSMKVCSAV